MKDDDTAVKLREEGRVGGGADTRRGLNARVIVALLTLAAAVGGALAGCHPTGITALDYAYGALTAAIVTLAASRASRASLLVLATVGVIMSRSWLLVPAGVALMLAFGAVFLRRSYRRLNALVGAIAVQPILRWPHVGFQGATVLIGAAAVTFVLFSGWRRSPRRWRRITLIAAGTGLGLAVILSAPVAVSGLRARSAANRAVDAANLARSEIQDGNTAAAVAALRRASAAFGSANTQTASWWTLGGRLVPIVSQQEHALTSATAAGRDLAGAATDEASGFNVHNLAYHDGRFDLDSIEAMSGRLGSLDAQIAHAQLALQRVRSPWLTAPLASRLDRFAAELTKARNGADLGVRIVNEAPYLLGGHGVRHYFVAFMNPSETRGLDGLIGAFGELTADQGRITLSRSGDTDLLDRVPLGSRHITQVPQYLSRYGGFSPANYFQDLTYSPDFPTVAKVVSEMYPQSGGDTIDGVLALDPDALAALLRFTGPIQLAGVPERLTAANASDFLIRGQYLRFPAAVQTQRLDILHEALSSAFHALVGGSLPAPQSLAATLGSEVREGRLLFWSNHPGEQPLLARLGLAGTFPQPGASSDVLAVTVANAANNKIDAYLHESVADHVSYNPASGEVRSTVTVTLHNAAPGTGLPAYVIGNNSGVPPGTNYMWLSVYSPLKLTSVTATGSPFRFSAGVPELGVDAYSTYVEVPPESTRVLTLSFAGSVTPGPSYRLALRLQPLTSAPHASVSVTAAPGWPLTAGMNPQWVADANEVQTHGWSFTRR